MEELIQKNEFATEGELSDSELLLPENSDTDRRFVERKNVKVVIVHGLAAKPWHMSILGQQIKWAGFQISYFRYASWWKSIQIHARALCEFVQDLRESKTYENIAIVAHSMGCIVARQAMLFDDFPDLRRIVMLAPPNLGSPAARRLSRFVPYSKTVEQISDDSNSLANQLPGTIEGVEVGCVEASYDWVIPPPSSHLPGEKDHVKLFSGHNGLLVRPSAAKQVIHFLDHGVFLKKS